MDGYASEESAHEFVARRLNCVPVSGLKREDLLELPIREQEIPRVLAHALHGPSEAILSESAFARVEQQARRSPNAPAVIDDLRTLTYAELVSHVRTLAASLNDIGICGGHIVAVGGPRNAGSSVAFLAVEMLGAVYTPVDVHWPQARIEHILASSAAAALVLTDAATSESLWAGAKAQYCPVVTMDWRVNEGADMPGLAHCAADAPKYVLFTSGSTGTPKGAIIEQQGMMNHVQAKIADLEIGSLDCVAQSAPLTFDVSIWQMLAALFVGAKVRFLNDDEIAQPHRLIAAVHAKQITILEVVPSMLRLMMDEVETAGTVDLGSLRCLLTVGEALPPSLARRWIDAFAHITLMNVYGPTELSDNVTHHVVAMPAENDIYTPIGSPIPNVSLYVLKEEAGNYVACSHGAPGELFVGGACVGRGYLADVTATCAAFFRDPFSETPTGRLYRTGDLVRYVPGRGLEYLGRVDRQVKVRGVRIEPGEIEERLRKHSGVSDAVVIVVEKDTENASIVACVCGTGVDVATLRAYALEHLPTSMVPQRIVLVASMPVTPNGKVDYGALAKLTSTRGPAAKAISVDQHAFARQVHALQEHFGLQSSDTVEIASWPGSQYILQTLAVLTAGAAVLDSRQRCHEDVVSVMSAPAKIWDSIWKEWGAQPPESLRKVIVAGDCASKSDMHMCCVARMYDLGGVLLAAGQRLSDDFGPCVLDSKMHRLPVGAVGEVFLSSEESAFLPAGQLGRYAQDGSIDLVDTA